MGNQFASGRGKDIAAVAGAIPGGSVAHDMGRQSRACAYDVCSEPVERCRVEHDYYEQERIVGYDVAYRYGNEVYRARMDHDAGRRVRVNIDIAE